MVSMCTFVQVHLNSTWMWSPEFDVECLLLFSTLLFKTFLCMGVLPACKSVYCVCVCCVLGGQERVLGPPELESLAVVSHHSGAGNWSRVHGQAILLTVEPSLQPHYLAFEVRSLTELTILARPAGQQAPETCL